MRIALIGLDGSGKSANINLMKKDADYSRFQFLWVRWQPSITVLLYKLKHYNKETGTVEKNNRRKQNDLNNYYQKKKGIKTKLFAFSAIRGIWFSYALADYRRQFFKKAGKYLKEEKDIIFDRYYLDLFVDQGINFGYGPEKIFSEILRYEKSFPEIDKIIYIRVTPKVCFERKNDIPNMEYLKKRYDIYEYLAKQKGWTVIDGEKSLEKVYFNIKREIM